VAASLPVQQGPSELTQRRVAGIADSASAGRLKTSLRRSHPRRSPDEINDALQHAYAQALERCEAKGERQVYGWLWRTADRRLCDRGRQLAHEMPAAACSTPPR